MPAYLVVAIISSPDGKMNGTVTDKVIATSLSAAQTKVTAAAPEYMLAFPAGSTAQVGLFQTDAAFTITK